MAMPPVHLQAPSQSLIGTLCAEVGQLQGQARALQASMAQCGDSVLLARLQADWLGLRRRMKQLKAMAASAAMDQLSLENRQVQNAQCVPPTRSTSHTVREAG